MHYFNQNKFYYGISVLEQPEEMRFQAILTVGISFHKPVFTVKTSCTPLWVSLVTFFICNTTNGRNHYNAHSNTILTAYFTILMHSEIFRKAVLGFSSPN